MDRQKGRMEIIQSAEFRIRSLVSGQKKDLIFSHQDCLYVGWFNSNDIVSSNIDYICSDPMFSRL